MLYSKSMQNILCSTRYKHFHEMDQSGQFNFPNNVKFFPEIQYFWNNFDCATFVVCQIDSRRRIPKSRSM